MHQPDMEEIKGNQAPPLTLTNERGHQGSKIVKHAIAGLFYERFAAAAISNLDDGHQHKKDDVDGKDHQREEVTALGYVCGRNPDWRDGFTAAERACFDRGIDQTATNLAHYEFFA